MLDVHPPHHSAHSWGDFLIHIATIVIGLLIAVGLEQAVEYVHHRESASHAREMLAEEIKHNRDVVRENIYALRIHEDYLFADLPVIARARAHKSLPTDRVITWNPYDVFFDTSWKTIHESGAAAYLSNEELARYGFAYAAQEYFNTSQGEASNAILRAGTVFYASATDRFDYTKVRATSFQDAVGLNGDAAAHAAFEDQAPGPDKLSRLTPAELDRLQQAVQESIYNDDQLIGVCALINSTYDNIASGRSMLHEPELNDKTISNSKR